MAREKPGHREGVRQMLHSKVSGSLASRGVIYTTEKMWNRKSTAGMTAEEKDRLERQRYNKRKWAQKERARYRLEVEKLQNKNGLLNHKNQELKKSVQKLQDCKFQLHSLLMEHEPECSSKLNSVASLLGLGGILCQEQDDEVDMEVKIIPTQPLASFSLQSGCSGAAKVLLCNLTSDGEEEGPMQRLTGKWVQINNGKIRGAKEKQQTRTFSKSRPVSKPSATVTSASDTDSMSGSSEFLSGERDRFGQCWQMPTLTRAASLSTEESDDSPVLTSSGFLPQGEAGDSLEGGPTSYLQMLNEADVASITPSTTISQVNAGAIFLQQVQSCIPNLEEMIHQRQNSSISEQTTETAILVEGGSALAQDSDAIITPELIPSKGASSIDKFCPWFVSEETTMTTETPVADIGIVQTYAAEEIVTSADTAAEKELPTFTSPSVSTGRRRTVSETAATTSCNSRSAPRLVVTISGTWNGNQEPQSSTESARTIPLRTQSLPSGVVLSYCPITEPEQSITDEPQKLEITEEAQNQDLQSGDVMQVVEIVDEEGNAYLPEDEDQQMSTEAPDLSGPFGVCSTDLPPTPSSPPTSSPLLSSAAIFCSSDEVADTPFSAISPPNGMTVSYVMAQ